MAPKIKFSRETIIQEAFQMAVEQGLNEISVRKLAARLGCSIAPIYVNFKNTKELTDAVKQEITSKLWRYSTLDYTNLSFYNIGIGQILFACHYPNLMRDMITHKLMEPAPDHEMLASLLQIMRQDPLIEDVSDDILKHLLASMSYLTQGICVQIISSPSDTVSVSELITLLGVTGSQLIYAAKVTDTSQLIKSIQWYRSPDDIPHM